MTQALEIEVRLLGVAGDDRHRRERLGAHELAKGFRQEADGLAAAPELEELDGRAAAGGFSGNLVSEGAEHVGRELEDLVGRAVAQLERLDLDVVEVKLLEHVSPVGETVVEVQLLGDVAGERHALLLGGGVEHDGELDRAHVLRLVDEDVLILEHCATPRERTLKDLVDAQEKRVVFPVERSGLVLVSSVDTEVADAVTVVLERFFIGEQNPRRVPTAPGVRPLELLFAQCPGAPSLERVGQPLLVGH